MPGITDPLKEHTASLSKWLQVQQDKYFLSIVEFYLGRPFTGTPSAEEMKKLVEDEGLDFALVQPEVVKAPGMLASGQLYLNEHLAGTWTAVFASESMSYVFQYTKPYLTKVMCEGGK